MKKFNQRDDHGTDKSSKSFETMRRKNMKRLGGGGLSLQTFANLKSENSRYNPALIKKQKEFYKNAKYVSKFRKSLKQENLNDKDEIGESSKVEDDKQKGKQHKKRIGLEDVYRQKHEEMEKARMEKEAMIQAKKEAREEAEARRKSAKGKMLKKTRYGQPVMKYRIEHLLESIKNSAGNNGSSSHD